MIESLSSPETWLAIGTLATLEIVLGVDNIVFLAIVTGRLPREQRALGYRVGLIAALVSRLALLSTLFLLSHLEKTLFTLGTHDITAHDIVLMVGGLFLLGKSSHEVFESVEGEGEHDDGLALKFQHTASALDDDHRTDLQKFAANAAAGRIVVEVTYHPSEEALANQRAAAIRELLASHGLTPDRVEIQATGSETVPDDLRHSVKVSSHRATASFAWVIAQVMFIDLIFSLDSVITAVGMAKELWIMVTAVIIAVGVMLVFAQRIGDFVHSHPSMKILALSFLMLIGVLLIAEGMDQHVEKTYVYFAMGFSFFVEILNLRMKKNVAKRTEPAH